MGVPTHKSACPQCRAYGKDTSGDNLQHYDNGTAHCFSCGYDDQTGQEYEVQEKVGQTIHDVQQLPFAALSKRGISLEWAKKYGVRVEFDQETGADRKYYFPVYRAGKLLGYQAKPANEPGKRKSAPGKPYFIGETKGADPFGSAHVGDGGKFVIVTEGAEDTLAAAELLAKAGKKWRVVGTMGTERWQKMIGFFQNFEKVVIAFDQDPEGQEAAAKFAAALSPGQGYIAHWEGGANDPNDMLRANHVGRFLQAINSAKPLQLSEIITGEEVWQRMEEYEGAESIQYPKEWPLLQEKLEGIRRGEISMWTAGSGVGKTSFVRRLKQHVIASTDWRLGEIELEERPEKSWRGLMEFQAGKRWIECTPEEKRAAWEATYGTKRIATLDHRAEHGRGQSLLGKLKHLKHAQGADIIVLDHITLAVSEFGEGEGNAAQDRMMGEFLEFVEQTNAHLCLISHLRKTSGGGKSFETGAVPAMDDLKGSGSLKQIAFDIVGVSRNQQEPDEYLRNVSTLNILKCRETGRTGMADRLFWNDSTRQLEPADEVNQDADE